MRLTHSTTPSRPQLALNQLTESCLGPKLSLDIQCLVIPKPAPSTRSTSCALRKDTWKTAVQPTTSGGAGLHSILDIFTLALQAPLSLDGSRTATAPLLAASMLVHQVLARAPACCSTLLTAHAAAGLANTSQPHLAGIITSFVSHSYLG